MSPTSAPSGPSAVEARSETSAGTRVGPDEGDPPRDGSALPAFRHTDTSAGQFRANALANLAYLVFNGVLQLWFTRFLVHSLGVALYGVVPLAVNVSNCMSVLTVALGSSVGRYLTVHFAQEDCDAANRTFNTSLFASIALALALTPAVGALAFCAPMLLDIPPQQGDAARLLLLCTGTVFLLNAVGSNFVCSAFAKNRLGPQRVADGLGLLAQVGFTSTMFAWYGPSLTIVGCGLLVMAVVRQACYQFTWRRLTPELRISPAYFSRERLREVLSMGGWFAVDNAGTILLLQLDLILANRLCGAHMTGIYAPALQCYTLLSVVGASAASAIGPTLIARHAQGRRDSLVAISIISVKFLGLAMALPIGLVAGLSPLLFRLWLGDEYASAWPLVVLLVAPLILSICVRPLNSVNQAERAVKWPAIALLISGLLTVPSAILLVGPLGMGIYGIAVARGVVWSAKNALWNPIYTAGLLGLRRATFIRPMWTGVACTGAVGLLGWALVQISGAEGWLGLLLIAAAVSAVYVAVLIPLSVRGADRAMLLRMLSGAR